MLERRDLLDQHTVLLVYSLAEPSSQLTLVHCGASRSWDLPSRRELETAALGLAQLWQERRQRSIEQAAELEQWLAATLLAPALAELEDERLVIVAEGALGHLPFEALPDPRFDPAATPETGSPRLLARHEVVQWPSLAAWTSARSEPARAPTDRFLAVIADPVFGSEDPRLLGGGWLGGLALRAPADLLRSITWRGDDSRFDRLPHTLREANDILGKVSATRPASEPPLAAIGFDANRDLVLSGVLEPYRYVHIATHGQADAPRTEGPGLVLSLRDREGSPIRGVLSASDIQRLRLRADLVVLSGCKTGLGRSLGDGARPSLAEAFLAAGARRVIVSLWDVSDRSTAELMNRFYDRLLVDGLPPAAALRAAQLSMARDPQWSHPSHWAGFVFEGDWR